MRPVLARGSPYIHSTAPVQRPSATLTLDADTLHPVQRILQRPSTTLTLDGDTVHPAQRTLQAQQSTTVSEATLGMPALVPTYMRRTAATRGAGFAASVPADGADVVPRCGQPQSSTP